jgi:hypothetical protein
MDDNILKFKHYLALIKYFPHDDVYLKSFAAKVKNLPINHRTWKKTPNQVCIVNGTPNTIKTITTELQTTSFTSTKKESITLKLPVFYFLEYDSKRTFFNEHTFNDEQ